jgi:hypothetical protein
MAQNRGVVEYDEETGLPTSSPGGGKSPSTYDSEPDEPSGKVAGRIGRGPLLDKTRKKAAQLLWDLWTAQDATHKGNYSERWKANRLRLMGIPGVELRMAKDRPGEWKCYAPPGGAPLPPVMNRMARNCRRLIAHLLVDKPIPEAQPSGASDDDPDKAEFASRVLQQIGGEGGVDDVELGKEAMLTACWCGSGFRRWYVEPKGGGHRPREILAHPAAMMEDQAETDPATGTTAVTFVKKFVEPGGRLVDDPESAELEWLPKLCGEVLDGRQVRPIPQTARHVSECTGLLLATYTTWGELKAIAPKWADRMIADREALVKVLGAGPERPKDFLPDYIKEPKTDAEIDDDTGEPDDDTLVFTLTGYFVISETYPKGAYIIVVGNDDENDVVYRDEWTMEDGKRREIPVDQFKQFSDWSRDFYGFGLMDLLGNMGELVHSIIVFMLDYMEKFSNRKTFVPSSSNLTAKRLEDPDHPIIFYTGRELPKEQDIADFPEMVEKMLERFLLEHDEETGITAPAMGESDPNVQSGLHQQQIMEAVAMGLSSVKQNAEKGFIRGWRVQAQEIKEGYTTEQELSWVGEDKEYTQAAFHGSDLTYKDFVIAKGSFTGLTPSAKMAMAEHGMALADPATGKPIVSGPELRRMWMENTGGLLGVQDDPFYMRVKRQIKRWAKGPPKDMMAGAQPSVGPGIEPAPEQFGAPEEVPLGLAVGGTVEPPDSDRDVAAQPPGSVSQPEVASSMGGSVPTPTPPAIGSAPVAGAPSAAGTPPSGVGPAPLPPTAPGAPPGAPAGPMAPPPPDMNDPAVLAGILGAEIFDMRITDRIPEIAMIRYQELSREEASARFGKFPPWWQAVLTTALDQARLDAGVLTMEEQQIAAQEQAQQQAQQATDQAVATAEGTEAAKAANAPPPAAGASPAGAPPGAPGEQAPGLEGGLAPGVAGAGPDPYADAVAKHQESLAKIEQRTLEFASKLAVAMKPPPVSITNQMPERPKNLKVTLPSGATAGVTSD